MKPALSVICTAKNAEATISDTLESVCAQSFQDWELIVVDDGSNDRTAEVVTKVSQEDPRIRLIPTDGIGRAVALNLAIEHARAPLISNIDADDLMHPDLLQVLVQAAESESSFAVLCTDFVIVGAGETPVWDKSSDGTALRVSDVTRKLLKHNPVCHSAVLMRKTALAAAGGYDESLTAQIDYDLWIRLAQIGNRIGRIAQQLAAKRIHAGQSFEARDRLQYLINSARTQSRAIKVLKGHPGYWILLILRFLWGMRPNRMLARPRLLFWRG